MLNEAKQLNPRFTTARYNLAQVLFALERYSELLDKLGDLMKLPIHHSTYRICCLLVAKCLDRVAAFKECVEYCDKCLARLPNDISFQRVRAETIVDGFCIGTKKDGVHIVERASLEFFTNIVNEPQKRVVTDYCYLARLQEWMGKVDTALETLEIASNSYPEYWEIPFNRATFLWRKGNLKAAIFNAQLASKLAPWRPQPLWILSDCYNSAGRKQEALEAQKQAEAISERRMELTNHEQS